ncbi:MarR family transcriptional regulator [Tamaricihabitans halophyticus]|uniref:MarR family transcriptional regulator n=1 Tax=Tamaricihabitans halophyticus TaxID=1262583 RepID=A0A4R2QMN2_9PSEU|nr:MarR family transcriptional regulator [Tamaricihabitans halophyticus]TCP50820.1 MarR family transcriptional regulator [Tamaricihabitans halophyticus]
MSAAAAPPEGTEQDFPVELASADRIASALVRFMRLLGRAKQQFAASSEGLEHTAFMLLARLVTDGAQRLTTLAESVMSDPSTVSRQVAPLVREGLVERRPDSEDRRASLLAVTDDGMLLFEAGRRQRDMFIANALREWASSDVEQLTSLLERLATDFENELTDLAPGSEAVPRRGDRGDQGEQG